MPETILPPCCGIVPARYASTRFPGKPLFPILGEPMFAHVLRRAARCPELSRVVLATDDARIHAAAVERGFEAVMTNAEHPSGSDRVLQAATLLDLPADAVVVNIQGDEPAIEPGLISALLRLFVDPAVRMATPVRPITADEAASPHVVKAVWSASTGRALYFSRAPIPFHRDAQQVRFWGHVGLYAYRLDTLHTLGRLEPSPLERAEKLEQLRALEAGVPIHVVTTEYAGFGVDTPEDVARAEQLLQETAP